MLCFQYRIRWWWHWREFWETRPLVRFFYDSYVFLCVCQVLRQMWISFAWYSGTSYYEQVVGAGLLGFISDVWEETGEKVFLVSLHQRAWSSTRKGTVSRGITTFVVESRIRLPERKSYTGKLQIYKNCYVCHSYYNSASKCPYSVVIWFRLKF